VASDKKIRANRENGRKGKGPTSPDGKAWSRRNALKSGLFSKELVVAAAGEKQEDYDAILLALERQFSGQDVLSDFILNRATKIMWSLQRVSRYETAEIQRQCNTARYRRSLDKAAEVDALKARFLWDFGQLCNSAPRSTDRVTFSASLDNIRRQLEQTSNGLEFLLEQLIDIEKEIERDGCLSPWTADLLFHVCGVADEHSKFGLALNQFAVAERERFKDDKEADKTKFEQNKRFFLTMLKYKTAATRARKKLIENLESSEEEDYLAGLVMPPADVLEKIHRVEAALWRDFFRCADRLHDTLYGTDR
jgi:hypothetical protein